MAKRSHLELLKRLHVILGVGGVILFIMTGQYMRRFYNHLADLDDVPRALMRAGHIYILISSIVHAMLGIYLRLSEDRRIQFVQFIGSILFVLSFVLLVFSFFKELPTSTMERPISRYGLYLLLAGGILHGFYLFETEK